jgi:hypothetical protein
LRIANRDLYVGLDAVFLNRHPFFTIRNLTRRTSGLSNRRVMTVITVKRTIVRRTRAQRSAPRRSSREFAQFYLAGEQKVEFTIEVLLFAIIVAISAWPIFEVIYALNQFS